jgi:hypothetical protein
MMDLPEGYTLKKARPGWFVDGKCGYLVSSTYYSSKNEALSRAREKIEHYAQLPPLERPAWFV